MCTRVVPSLSRGRRCCRGGNAFVLVDVDERGPWTSGTHRRRGGQRRRLRSCTTLLLHSTHALRWSVPPFPLCLVRNDRRREWEYHSVAVLFPQAYAGVAEGLYRKVLGILDDDAVVTSFSLSSSLDLGNPPPMDKDVAVSLRAHCLLGLAKLSLSGTRRTRGEINDSGDVADGPKPAEDLARSALECITSSTTEESAVAEPTNLLCLYAWVVPTLHQTSRSSHVCAARRIVAESCLRAGRPDDARRFLADAVRDSPGNFDAALSLGGFRLWMLLFGGTDNDGGDDGGSNDAEDGPSTRKQLLKVAIGTLPNPILLPCWEYGTNTTMTPPAPRDATPRHCASMPRIPLPVGVCFDC